ncbi:MAG: UbiA family prenyltransferase, partial [Planctomycetota bacterium]
MTPPPLAAELAPGVASVAPAALVADDPRGLAATLADVSRLVRPRIAVMVLATVAAAAWLTAGRPTEPIRLVWLLAGTALVAASSSIANQILERRSDRLMKRTAARPLVAGRLAVSTAWWLAAATLVVGTAACWLA